MTPVAVLAAVLALAAAALAALLAVARARHGRETTALREEARERERERARLSDQIVTAEQDERRRLALYLHDTSVQSLSGVSLMLDAALHSLESGRADEVRTVVTTALERVRATIRGLRDLSFNLEPVVLRDQGFAPAVTALAEQLAAERRLDVELDVRAAEALGPKTQAVLYQIIREALDGAVRRGPPTRISVAIAANGGGVETVIADDAPGERRRSSLEGIAERVRTLGGVLAVEPRDGDGTRMRVTLPRYVAET